MEWREFLEKDSLDGKGANDKIKPANWVANNSDEKTENWTYMKPEDFSDIAHSEAHDDAHKIPKRPSEYSPENKPRKWKTPKHGTIHTGQEKKPATAEGEKNSKGNDMNYNRRGDELGSIERYQNKLRHGEPIPAPSLGVSGGGKGKKRQAHGHEGRHRAEAATREGEKTIPVGIGHSALRTGGEKKLTSRQVASLRGENTMIGQSERSIRQNVKDGIQSLKSWESWLEKEDKEIKKKPTMFPRIRREFEDEKDEDPMVYDNKTASWETWLEKNDPCWEGYEQYGMKDKDGKKVPNCVKKNNATETSHKEGEKKEEWNGKFDNSTTRDDAENDDDKAIGEEESLEELTDGKLEEVEKLKSWEVFLKATVGGGTEHSVGESFTEEEAKKRPDMQKKNPPKYIKSHFANSNTGKDAVIGTGKQIPTPRGGTFQDTKNTKNLTENDVTAGAVRTAKKYPELKQYVPEAQVEEDKGLGGDTETPVKTQEELDKEFYERTQPEPKGTKSDKKVLARRKRKSWELWLEKKVTHEDPTKGVKGGMTKVPITQAETPDEIMEAANNPKTTIKLDAGMKKSWNEWLEKMQGAGDARYGNQHLTGMEQKPVADDESIDLSAESEENNEKQEKTEDKEDKDNKPYKALSQE